MTAKEKIQLHICKQQNSKIETLEDVDKFIEENEGIYNEILDEFRCSYHFETKLKCGYSRHYECKSVAKKLFDGTWVGFDYYYGGGKYGQPSEMPWLENAYFLKHSQQTKVIDVFELET